MTAAAAKNAGKPCLNKMPLLPDENAPHAAAMRTKPRNRMGRAVNGVVGGSKARPYQADGEEAVVQALVGKQGFARVFVP